MTVQASAYTCRRRSSTESGRQGDTPIENGKIAGDDISFTVTRKFNDMEFKIDYKCKASADSIQLKFTMMDNDMSLTMKRAAS